MNEDPNLPDEERGLYPKYRIIRLDSVNYDHKTMAESPVRIDGLPMAEVDGPAFVIKLDDPHAGVALQAYARACRATHPVLANDIMTLLSETDLARLRARLSQAPNDGA